MRIHTLNKTVTLLAALLLFLISGCGPSEQPEATHVASSSTPSAEEWTPRTLSSQYASMSLVRVVHGLEHPWSVAFLPDGSKLITERPGRLVMARDGEIHEISGVPEVLARGQGGLMEVVLHPDYENNGWIYITYSQGNEQEETATTLIRAQLQDHTLINLEELLVQNRFSSPGRHYGSKLAWTLDGKLLMSIGDRGREPPRAQDLGDHAGTLLRLNDDGSIPEDNPFVGVAGALPEIYSYGHRNIQGLAVHPVTGEIWATEHGPRGGDELNRIEPAMNYGWPVVSLGLDYRSQEQFRHTRARSMEGMVDPVYEFLPTHAPSGLAIITHDLYSDRWVDNLLAGGLRSERIRRLLVQDNEVWHDEELLLQEVGRIRDVRIGPEGHIYVLTDHSNGSLYRLEPN